MAAGVEVRPIKLPPPSVLRLHDNELYPAITMPTPHYYVVIAAPEVLGGADCASGTMCTSQPAGACVRSAGTASSVICLASES